MIFRSNYLEDWMTEKVVLTFLTGYMKLTKSDVLHLDLDKYTPTIVFELHKNNYILHTHLKTDEIELHNKAKELGIDQCSFDDVALIKLVEDKKTS